MKHKRILNILLISLLLLPPIALFWAMALYNVNLPFRDSLPYAYMFMEKAFLDKSITFGYFFLPRAEEIFAIPMLFMVGLASITHWNISAELYSMAVLALIDFLLLWQLVRVTLRSLHPIAHYSILLTISTSIFSYTQWEAWSLSLSITYFFTTTFFLGALIMLQRRGLTRPNMVIVAMLCLLSSFSLPNGMLSWIALIPLIWHLENESSLIKRHKITALWILLFGCTVFLERAVWNHVVRLKANYLYVFTDTDEFFRTFFTLIGASIFSNSSKPSLALILGIVIFTTGLTMLINTWISEKKTRAHALPWICVFLFFAGSTFLICMGRAKYAWVAFTPRYIAVVQYVGIAALCLFALHYQKRWILTSCISILIIYCIVQYSMIGLDRWQYISVRQRQALACLQTYDISSRACLYWIYPWDIPPREDMAYAVAPLLVKMNFLDTFSIPKNALFVEQPKKLYGYIEKWDAEPELEELAGTGTMVSGWAILDDCKTPEHVVITTGKERKMIGHTIAILPRPERIETHGRCARNAGWEVEIPLQYSLKELSAWAFDPRNNTMLHLPREGL